MLNPGPKELRLGADESFSVLATYLYTVTMSDTRLEEASRSVLTCSLHATVESHETRFLCCLLAVKPALMLPVSLGSSCSEAEWSTQRTHA